MGSRTILIIAVILFSFLCLCEGSRCFQCRSRSKLGDCKDPFPFNNTYVVQDVLRTPCASGWCSKIIEGDIYGEDHDLATERSCLQRTPPDNTERCAEVEWSKRKVFACFCHGDLCNTGASHTCSLLLAVFSVSTALMVK